MGERSLVTFTLLAQAAAGALVGLAGLQLLGAVDVLGPLSFITVGLLLLAATTISTLHLGAPHHAPWAIANWRSSWLSREIVGLGLTGGLVAVGALMALLGDAEGTHAARTVIAVLAAAAGVFLVVAMVRLYSVRTVPEWRPLQTAGGFAGTTLRLGSVAAAILAALETLPDGSVGGAAAWPLLMLGIGAGLWLVVATGRPGAGTTDMRAGALLVRRELDVAGGLEDRAFRLIAIGAVTAAAGMLILSLGPALLAAILLLFGLASLAVGELDVRERFYEAAPSRGRDVMRPSAASPTTVTTD